MDATTQQQANTAASKSGPGSRVSLACLPCRSRHVRCDAKKPQCDRCIAEGKECLYAKSRRGGLDRAALAARRNQVASLTTNGESVSPRDDSDRPGSHRSPGSGRSGDESSFRQTNNGSVPPFGSDDGNLASQTGVQSSLRLFTPPDDLWPSDSSANSVDLQSLNIQKDPYIDMYYKCFHKCHPCVLPRRYLERLLQDTTKRAEMKALISVMRFIGSIFISAAQQSAKNICRQLEELVSIAISETPSNSSSWIIAQSHLLFSVGVYWLGNPIKSRQHIDTAIQMAFESGMFRREFAAKHGHGNPVLQECLRRTWWQIYVVDAYYAAIKRQDGFPTFSIEATMELPCEEDEYESGNIPEPKTLEEFDAREFASDDTVFSSFAYLIGAVSGMATAMFRALSIATAPAYVSNGRSPKVLEAVDAIIDGWMLLIPDSKKDVFTKNGEVDELIFQAYMALHATTAGLHRPFSECHFDPLECISSCSTPPPAQSLPEPSDFKRIHTAKCIKAAEAQIRLLALPGRPCSHSPFTVCMLTTGTLSLLAACKFLLKEEKLSIARDQIRVSVGYHKVMAAVWSQAKSNLQEVQAIAREVLAIGANGKANKAVVRTAEISVNSGQPSSNSGTDFSEGLSDDALSSVSLDNLQTYWNMSDMQMDISSPWWMCGPEMS
ncbi:C6 finger domain transcription factor iacK [Cladobotryum mycophilum]|uniref:C6 finger domain transcription factor iacK n=1 Tax=Cladobotryum mycophilum TaxID=491253 RepID=A0ABR0SQG2_9HYPO